MLGAWRVVKQWGSEHSSATACVVYGSAEGVLRREYGRRYPDLDLKSRMVRVRSTPVAAELHDRLIRGVEGLLPTVPASPVYHPIILQGMRYPSLYSFLELFGLPFGVRPPIMIEMDHPIYLD